MTAVLFTPTLIGDIDRLCSRSLDNGNELHPLRMHLIAEKPIHVATEFFIGGIDGTKDIEIDMMLAQVTPALHHAIKGSVLLPIAPVRIVKFPRTVHTQADQKIVLFEKR